MIDFLLRFVLAPNKGAYLRRNWLTALSLAVPALRVVRLVRLARLTPAARSLRLVSVVGSMNRGMRALRTSLGRHGAGYVFGLTVIVSLLGAAGMLAFEQHPDGTGLRNYGEALWWTVMMITTIGSDYWPVTPEGRTLTLLLSIYGMGVLGFVTATLASFFVGRDAQGAPGGQGNPRALEELRREVARLREELARRRPPE